MHVGQKVDVAFLVVLSRFLPTLEICCLPCSVPERQLKNKVLISHFHLTLNHCTYIMHVSSTLQRVSMGGELPYMVVIGMCSSQGDSFSAVLVINRVRFLHLVSNWVCFLKEATLSSLSIRPSTKALLKLCLLVVQLSQLQWSLIGYQFLVRL